MSVVNKFDLDQPGEITDYGAYASMTNLTNLEPLTADGDTVTARADAGSFYYQGVLASAEIPWNVAVTYTLDGKEITPDELGGKSGKLEMEIAITRNPDANSLYFDNYTLQMQVVLDGAKCKNVQAPDSTVADQGSDLLVTCLVLPGSEKTFALSADVTDFSLEPISANGVPAQCGCEHHRYRGHQERSCPAAKRDYGSGRRRGHPERCRQSTERGHRYAESIRFADGERHLEHRRRRGSQIADKSTEVLSGLPAAVGRPFEDDLLRRGP